MRFSLFSLLLACLFIFSSCEKLDLKKDKDNYKKDNIPVCTWDGSLVSDTNVWEEFIVEPLVTDPACGCVVSGLVKYVKKDAAGNLKETGYLIKYMEKCTGWAYLVTCKNGDCGDKNKNSNAEVCKFDLNCTSITGG